MLWRFQDSAGIWRVGKMDRFTDYGGTDVTYWFRDQHGNIHLVSGARLKAASPIPEDAANVWNVTRNFIPEEK